MPFWYGEQIMKLEQYLALKGQSQTAFAHEAKIPQATINRYITGERFPSRDMIRRIEAATDGAVTVLDWFKQEKVAS